MTESGPRQSATFRSHAYRSSHSKGAGNAKKTHKICAHAQLFICHFPPSYTSPVHLSGTPHKPLSCVLWLALLCLDSTTFSQFLLPEFFTNNTKLGGISCLCIPHRNTLSKIKGTSFKWGGKSRTGGIMGGCVCVCVCVRLCLLDTLLLSGRDCGS